MRVNLKRAIERGFGTQKRAACHVNYSPEMINKVLSGERPLPPSIGPKLSRKHLIIGIAVAEETTRYRCFEYIDSDRHPQTMLRRAEKEDLEAEAALKPIAYLLIDKHNPEDLNPEERHCLSMAGRELCDRIQADINLIMELDDRYNLELSSYLTEKKKETAYAAR